MELSQDKRQVMSSTTNDFYNGRDSELNDPYRENSIMKISNDKHGLLDSPPPARSKKQSKSKRSRKVDLEQDK